MHSNPSKGTTNPIPVPFDTIHPNDIIQFQHITPEGISKEEAAYIDYTVKRLSNRLLPDVIKLATEGIVYLDRTQTFQYSRERCEDYYNVVKCLCAMMHEVCQTTEVCYLRMFNMAWRPSIMRIPIQFELYDDICPHIAAEDMKKDKNYKLLESRPFLMELAWHTFVDKMYALKDMIDVGLRLSLEYTLAHYEFCSNECCKMPKLSDVKNIYIN